MNAASSRTSFNQHSSAARELLDFTLPYAPVTAELSRRLWAKVRIRCLDDCWLWEGDTSNEGYGLIHVPGAKRGTRKVASRIAYELTYGEIEDRKLLCCHSCDTPPCCNPYHIFLGTNAVNMADCGAKGRTKDQRGSKHGLTRLTEGDVVAMRDARARGEKLQDIADRYSVRKSTASYILRGLTWSHVPMPNGTQ